MAPRSFHLFQRMALELQHMVWEQAIADFPRVIRTKIRYDPLPIPHSTVRIEGSSQVPTILHVCSASRGVALKRYSLLPSRLQLEPGHHASGRARYYVNFSVDTIYICLRQAGAPQLCRALEEISWYGRIIHGDARMAIKHVAFRSHRVDDLYTRATSTPTVVHMVGRAQYYDICMSNRALRTISIALDNTRFGNTRQCRSTHKYTLDPFPANLAPGRGEFSTCTRNNIRDTIHSFVNSPNAVGPVQFGGLWANFLEIVKLPWWEARYGTYLPPTLELSMIRKSRR